VTTFIILIAFGLLLIVAEIFVPGGILGVVGILCLIAAAISGYFLFETATANIILLSTIVGLMVGALLFIRFFPTSRLASRFVANQVVGDLGHQTDELLGQRGVAETPLRPSGAARIGNKRVDVIAEGTFIPAKRTVEVIKVEGARVVVREVSS
jgi:membrane-bound serine protease (ClpP class)